MSNQNIEIRLARLSDAETIVGLINRFAVKDLMLERSVESIIENIRNFLVAVDTDHVIGCCALAFFTTELAEIRSVAIDDRYQKQGVGRLLVKAAEELLRQDGVRYSFVLTRSEPFFSKIGYTIVDKEKFPQKIWRDCMQCNKLMHCDETAMEKQLI